MLRSERASIGESIIDNDKKDSRKITRSFFSLGQQKCTRTMTSSPFISPTLSKLSSPPAPSVLECMSVAK